MTTYIICDNGTQREMTTNEIAHYEAAATKMAQEIAETNTAKEQRAALRSTALAKLGLNNDEIEVLFG